MRFTIKINEKEHGILELLDSIMKQILEYESKYQQILDIIMEKEA